MAERHHDSAPALTAPLSAPRAQSRRRHVRFRRTLITMITVVCFVGGALSLGLSPVLTYFGEVSRQKLAAHNIFLSFGDIVPQRWGVTLHRVSLQVPEYQLIEQFESLSVVAELGQLLHLRPTVSVTAVGLGGMVRAGIEISLKEPLTLTQLTLERIALRSSTTLAPLGLTNGVVSGSLTLHRQPSSECEALSPPCYSLKVFANQLEKTQPSELVLPKSFRDAFPIPYLTVGSPLTIPAVPRTNVSVSLSADKSRASIRSVNLKTSGVELTGTGSIPAGFGGTSTIGWYEDVKASGSLQLNDTLAGFVALLRSSSIQGSIAADTPTNFAISGPFLSPKVTLKAAERSSPP